MAELTSAAKPSTWSFSVFSDSSVMKMGKYAFLTPIALIFPSNQEWICSHTPYAQGRRM